MIRTHNINEIVPDNIGASVTVSGWVNSIRRLGKLSFVELRDSSGLIQLTFVAGVTMPESIQVVAGLCLEAVMLATGTVRARPGKQNEGAAARTLEIEVSSAEVFNQPESLPFAVVNDTRVANKLKIEHRTLYLRRERLHRNMILRSRIFQFVRGWLVDRGFHEIDTPVLFKTTVGGAREFIVPTRSHPGKFYVLRQSPQQLKQMLMASGIEKYFQICKLFHDAHARSQRQLEFTALDIEVAFAAEPDIMALIEDLMRELVAAANLEIVIGQSIPQLNQDDCFRRFGSEEPDLRFAIECHSITDRLHLVRIPFRVDQAQAVTWQFERGDIKLVGQLRVGVDRAAARSELDGKLRDIDCQAQLTETRPGDMIHFLTGSESAIRQAVQGRKEWVAAHLNPDHWRRELTFLWTRCQPLFKQDPSTGAWKLRHQAFTAPVDPSQLEGTNPDLAGAMGREYVLSCNGAGLGGGSARIVSPELQRRVFQLDGMSETEIDFYFGPLLRALASGAPPHAGATLSLDALIRLLAGERHVSEVIPFPKMGNGQDPLTGAPDTLPDELLEEFGLKLLT